MLLTSTTSLFSKMYQRQQLFVFLQAITFLTILPQSSTISNGETANPGEFPYIVYMDRVLFDDPVCSGIIINENWVLTAAYCLRFATAGISFTAGEHNVSVGGEGEQLRRVVATVIHPNFTEQSTHGVARNDIALCKVAPPFDFNQDGVKPITLSTQPIIASNLTFAGWGEINLDYEINPTLQKANLVQLTDPDCAGWYPIEWDVNMMCATGHVGVGICYGDTGGPLIGRSDATNSTILYGIASRYASDACEGGKSSMFTQAAPYVNWIMETIANYNETDPISWAESINTCGGVLIGSAGMISYNVDHSNNPREVCVWTIRPTPGKWINMALKERSGGWVSKARIFDAEGTIGINERLNPGTSYGMNAEVVFITFYMGRNPSNGTGFILEFEGEMAPNPSGLIHFNDNYNLGSNTVVTVSHPSDGGKYKSHELSTWVVHNYGTLGVLTANITRLDTDCGAGAGDLLRIYSLVFADASFREDAVMCGNHTDGQHLIAQNNVFIAVFKSNGDAEGNGFDINFFEG